MWHLFAIGHGLWMDQVHDKCIAILVCCITKSLLFGIRGSIFLASPLPPPMLSRSRYNWNLSVFSTVVNCMLASWIWTRPCKHCVWLLQELMHEIHDKCIAILVCYNRKKLLFRIRGSRFWDSLGHLPILCCCKYDCNLFLLGTVFKCMLANWIWTCPFKHCVRQI